MDRVANTVDPLKEGMRAAQSTAVAVLNGPALPEQVLRRGINDAQWRTLTKSLFPGANPNSVLMVWDYCVARKLDPLKKPCHIVPMEVKDVATNRYEWRDVVMPGIYEHRTTAQRTGLYLGHSEPVFGMLTTVEGFTDGVPEWCAMTFYRWNKEAGQRVEFPVRVYFVEVFGCKRDGKPNARWLKAPVQMLTKCTEAAGLREAFPDEIGGEQTMEEMEGQRHVDVVIEQQQVLPKPDGYDNWLTDLQIVADEGEEAFNKCWANSKTELRDYLTSTDPSYWESLKTRAERGAAAE